MPHDVRSVGAAALRAMLLDDEELALIDVREERIFSESHLLFARSVPLSRLELRMARLVPRRATRIVLVDDADGLAERAAQGAGRGRLFATCSILDGGNAAWEAAGFELFSGVNVPSKAFGEFVEHESGTPSISARGAARADAVRHRHGGARLPAVRRIFARFDPDRRERARRRAGAARARHGAEARDAGGGQLRRAHALHHRRAVADQCGRAEQGGGAAQRHDGLEPRGLHARQRQDRARARRVARRARLGEVRGRAGRRASSASAASTRPRSRACAPTRAARLYLFDVRDPAEYAAGHVAGALSAPGGQLVQATDQYAGTLQVAHRRASTTRQVRAVMTASWLRADGLARGVRAGRRRATRRAFRTIRCSGEAPRDAAIDAGRAERSAARAAKRP